MTSTGLLYNICLCTRINILIAKWLTEAHFVGQHMHMLAMLSNVYAFSGMKNW